MVVVQAKLHQLPEQKIVGCKRCETACPTDFLSVRVYLGAETTLSLGLAY